MRPTPIQPKSDLAPLPECLRRNLSFQCAVAAWKVYRDTPDPGPDKNGDNQHLELGMLFGAMVFAHALLESDGQAFREEPDLGSTLLPRAVSEMGGWSRELMNVVADDQESARKWVKEKLFGFMCLPTLARDPTAERIFDAIKTEFVFRYTDHMGCASRTDHTIDFFVHMPIDLAVMKRWDDLVSQGYRWVDVVVLGMPKLDWKHPPKDRGAQSIEDLLDQAGLYCPEA